MSKDKLSLIKRDVYGRVLYYPNCAMSRSFVAVHGSKTLTQEQVDKLKDTFDLEIKTEV